MTSASEPSDAPHNADADRRRSFRADVTGAALVHLPEGALRCEIGNLSLGGALLHRAGGSSELARGTTVGVELRVDGGGWVRQSGRVLRDTGPIEPIAVAFGPLSPEVEDLIEDEVLAALEANRSPRVVVVDRSSARRRRLATALQHAGFCALEVSTPLEAIDVVERSRNHVAVAAIHESLTQTGGWELVKYLTDTHPRIKIALITDDELAESRLSVRRGEVDVLLCADGRSDLCEPVRRLVGTHGVVAA
jgi:CheY-like chemotaxis protein